MDNFHTHGGGRVMDNFHTHAENTTLFSPKIGGGGVKPNTWQNFLKFSSQVPSDHLLILSWNTIT